MYARKTLCGSSRDPREITIPAGPPAQTAPEKSPRQDKGPARYPRHHAGKTIYFIPIGDFPSGAVEDLVSYYRETLHLEINTVDPISIEDSVLDTERRQLVAEKLIASMRHALPKLASDPNALLIGFTTADMYPLGENWRFAFGWHVTQLRAAVVSTARIDLHYRGDLRRRRDRRSGCARWSRRTSESFTTDFPRAAIRTACFTTASWGSKNWTP